MDEAIKSLATERYSSGSEQDVYSMIAANIPHFQAIYLKLDPA